MPKPVKKPTRKVKRTKTTDPNVLAHRLMLQHTQAHIDPVEPVDFQGQLSAYMARLGAKGGRVSGAKRMEMPAKKRRAIAKRAAAVRWGRSKP